MSGLQVPPGEGRRAKVGAKLDSFAHRTESPGLVLRRGRRYLQTGCRRIIPNSSHRIALGDRVNQTGENDTHCAEHVNREASDTALPIASRPKQRCGNRFGRRRRERVRVSRVDRGCAAQKMRGPGKDRNPLKAREFGESRGVREGREKKKRGCAEKENASTCAV
jgi:hypothetical protein